MLHKIKDIKICVSFCAQYTYRFWLTPLHTSRKLAEVTREALRTAAVEGANSISAPAAVLTGTGGTLIHVNLALDPCEADRARAVLDGQDVVARPPVEAGLGIARVSAVPLARLPGEAERALAAEGVHLVGTVTPVVARTEEAAAGGQLAVRPEVAAMTEADARAVVLGAPVLARALHGARHLAQRAEHPRRALAQEAVDAVHARAPVAAADVAAVVDVQLAVVALVALHAVAGEGAVAALRAGAAVPAGGGVAAGGGGLAVVAPVACSRHAFLQPATLSTSHRLAGRAVRRPSPGKRPWGPTPLSGRNFSPVTLTTWVSPTPLSGREFSQLLLPHGSAQPRYLGGSSPSYSYHMGQHFSPVTLTTWVNPTPLSGGGGGEFSQSLLPHGSTQPRYLGGSSPSYSYHMGQPNPAIWAGVLSVTLTTWVNTTPLSGREFSQLLLPHGSTQPRCLGGTFPPATLTTWVNPTPLSGREFSQLLLPHGATQPRYLGGSSPSHSYHMGQHNPAIWAGVLPVTLTTWVSTFPQLLLPHGSTQPRSLGGLFPRYSHHMGQLNPAIWAGVLPVTLTTWVNPTPLSELEFSQSLLPHGSTQPLYLGGLFPRYSYHMGQPNPAMWAGVLPVTLTTWVNPTPLSGREFSQSLLPHGSTQPRYLGGSSPSHSYHMGQPNPAIWTVLPVTLTTWVNTTPLSGRNISQVTLTTWVKMGPLMAVSLTRAFKMGPLITASLTRDFKMGPLITARLTRDFKVGPSMAASLTRDF